MKRDLSSPLAVTPNPGDKPKKKKKRVTRTKTVITKNKDPRTLKDLQPGQRFNKKNPGKIERITTKTKTTPKRRVVKKKVEGAYTNYKSKTVTRKRKDGSTVTRYKKKQDMKTTPTTERSRTVTAKGRGKYGITSDKDIIKRKRKTTTKRQSMAYSRQGFKDYIEPSKMKKGKTKISTGTKKAAAKATITKRKGKEKVKSTYRRNK